MTTKYVTVFLTDEGLIEECIGLENKYTCHQMPYLKPHTRITLRQAQLIGAELD